MLIGLTMNNLVATTILQQSQSSREVRYSISFG
jgi:hypothetical protein